MKIFRNIFSSVIATTEKKVSNAWKYFRKFSTMNTEEVKKIWRETDAVCFDVDSTVIKNEGIDGLAEFIGKGEEVSKITKEAMKSFCDYRATFKMRLDMMAPTERQVEEYMLKNPHVFTPGAQELIQLLKSRNIPVYLVSGGLRKIITPVARDLGIPDENLFANRLIFKDGKYAGFDVDEPTSKNKGKAEVMANLKKKFGYKRLVMIGDGSIDAEAHPPADAFIGFGGNIVREPVKERAKWFVMSFQELVDELNK